jgi:hypothetical protein
MSRNNNNFRRKNRGRNNQTKRHDGGTRFIVPTHPPAFTAIPWYNLVVRIFDPPATVTSVGLAAAISTQLGVTFTGSVINVRLQSVRVWGALVANNATSSLQPLSVNVFDPIASSFNGSVANRVLEALADYPDAVKRAAVGYKYPKAQREVSLNVYNQNAVLLLSLQGAGAGSVVYFNVQWRTAVTTPIPALDDEFEKVVEDDVSSLVDRNMRDTLVRDEHGKIITLAEKFARLGYK